MKRHHCLQKKKKVFHGEKKTNITIKPYDHMFSSECTTIETDIIKR